MKKKTIRELNRLSIDQYRSADKTPVVMVLDNVRSLNNIGSIFRTCDAFAVSELVLCGISQTPPSAEIHKTALGAEDSVAWRYFSDILDAIAALRADGYTICCLEQVHRSIALQNFAVESGRRYAIIAGHEVDGVSQAAVGACDYCIEIPQRGTKHSLNVAVSSAIALWHFFDAQK